MRRAAVSWLFAAATLTLLLGPATTASATSTNPHAATSKATHHLAAAQLTGAHHACASSTKPGMMACAAVTTTTTSARTLTHPDVAPTGYGPADLQSAYGLQSASAGTRQTVAIVDAYDDPNAESDLGVYRSQYGLPACTTANGCLKKIDQNGGTNYPTANPFWGQEISLDLDTISAVCPNCHLLLVEANSANITDLGTGVNTAASLGAKIITNGYSSPESSSETGWDTQYYNHPGVALIAPTGNSGYGVAYPAASHYVTAVGGTTLNKTPGANTRGWTENAWPGTGSGCSAYEPKPSWQHDTGCTNRTVADVSADADSNTPVAIYDTYNAGGWAQGAGSTLASDIIAGTYALAGTPGSADYPASYPYTHPGALNDITAGSNGTCTTSYLCNAGTGYDGPTGLGTPANTTSLTPTGTLTGQITSGITGQCLDVNNPFSGGYNEAIIIPCPSGASWSIQADGTLHTTGGCLDIPPTTEGDSSNIGLSACDSANKEKWLVRSNGELVNSQSGTCLEADPSQPWLAMVACNDSAGQRWTMPYAVPVGAGPIVGSVSSGLCVDDASGKTTNKNKIDIYPCNNSVAQKWSIQANGTLQVLGKCMDIDAAGTANGTLVDLYTCNGTGAQQWRAQADGSLLNPQSGRCLADPAGTSAPGTQLLIWNCDGGTEQRWNLP